MVLQAWKVPGAFKKWGLYKGLKYIYTASKIFMKVLVSTFISFWNVSFVHLDASALGY